MSTDPLFKELRSNWWIIVFIGTLIVGWVNMQSRIANAENKINDLESIYQKVETLTIDMAIIKTDVGYIKVHLQ